LVARLLATEALWVRNQTSLKNIKWAIYARQKKNKKKFFAYTLGSDDCLKLTVLHQLLQFLFA
jgi:hypothetical protein